MNDDLTFDPVTLTIGFGIILQRSEYLFPRSLLTITLADLFDGLRHCFCAIKDVFWVVLFNGIATTFSSHSGSWSNSPLSTH